MKFRVPQWVPEALLIFSIIFGPLAFGATEPWSLAVVEIALYSLLLVTALRGFKSIRSSIYGMILPAAAVVLVIGFLQYYRPRPIDAPFSGLPFTASAPATRQALLLWGSYGALLLCAPQVLSVPGSVQRVMWVLFGLGVAVALVGIVQKGAGNAAYYGLRTVRHGEPFGPYANYNHAASMLAMSLSAGAGLLMARFGERRRVASVGVLSDLIATQLLLITLFVVGLIGIFMTGSRGAVGSLIMSVLLISMVAAGFLPSTTARLLTRGILIALALAFAALIGRHLAWIVDLFGYHNQSIAFRLSMLRSSVRMVRDFPVFGVGLGAIMPAFRAYQERLIQVPVEHLHCDWVELWAEVGFLGFAACFSGLALFLAHVIRSWRRLDSARLRRAVMGGLIAVIAFLVHELVDFSFRVPANAVIFLTILCCLDALVRQEKGGSAIRPTAAPAGSALWLGVAGLAALLVLESARPAVAELLAHRGDNESTRPAQVMLYKLAEQWDRQPDYLYRQAAATLLMAEADPAHRTADLRQALLVSTAALASDSCNPEFQYLQGAILWRLDRVDDAEDFLDMARQERPGAGG